MANDYARVMRSIWGDDDFRDLPHDAQWLYFHLLTSPALNYCGVTDWRPARIASLSRDLTAMAVEAASVDLEGELYTIVDRNTEEVLIRTFIKHDGLMGQENMACAMVKAHSGTASKALRGVIVHELIRLHDSAPALKGWKRADVQELLERDPLDPKEAFDLLPRFDWNQTIDPSVRTSVRTSIDPSVRTSVQRSGKGSVQGSVRRSPTPYSLLLTPTPNSAHQNALGQDTYLGVEDEERIVGFRGLKSVDVHGLRP